MPRYDFGKNAHTYDLYYQSDFGREVDRLEKQCVESLISKIPKGKALEIGCGTGHWTEYFATKGFEITATDISEEMLNVAKSKNIPGVHFIKANAENLPFENNSFDSVFAITVLEFVDDQEKAFDEIYRVLRPGGYFLAGVLNLNSEIGQNKSNDETFANAIFFTPEDLENKLKKFGEPVIEGCVVIENGDIIDNKTDKKTAKEKGAFLCALVRKE